MAKSKTANKRARQEAQKALKWILRSGVVTTALLALVVLLIQLQGYEIDLRTFAIGILILLVNAGINLLDYWRHEAGN